MKGIYWARIKKMLMTGMDDEGGTLLDAVVIIIIILTAILVLTHFGMTWNNVLTSFKKFFGYELGGL